MLTVVYSLSSVWSLWWSPFCYRRTHCESSRTGVEIHALWGSQTGHLWHPLLYQLQGDLHHPQQTCQQGSVCGNSSSS